MLMPIRMFAGLAVLLAAAPAAAQELAIPEVRYPRLPAAAADAAGFAPPGWRVEAQATGDLSGDGRADLAFVLRMTDPANILAHDGLGDNPFDTNPRILAVALGVAGGGYRLAAQDHRLIARRDYPTQSDPFEEELAIALGSLNVTVRLFMNAGGWDAGSSGFTFRWRDNALRLIGYDHLNVRRNSGCMTRLGINYLTGRVKRSTGRADLDRETVRWSRMPVRALLPIDRIGDGLAFGDGGARGNFPPCQPG
ncbi:MAG: hypothetical protein QOD42_1596 [Sphingomonadales bacterium]|jgi:hypothetical protein|nr:hypothetical protein [Sphingomonadales bacterium]